MAQRPESANACPHILHHHSFRPIYSKICLPANSHFYRGYDAEHAAVSDRPTYYTPYAKEAKSHGAQTTRHCVGLFRTTRPLAIYDIRYIAVILREYIRQRNAPGTPSESLREHAIQSGIYTATLALGLCSFGAQLELLYARYKTANALGDPAIKASLSAMELYSRASQKCGNPVELEGVRIAEGENDSEFVALLADLFPEADGYIAPSLKSPYRAENDGTLNEELVIFNPQRSDIKQVPIATNADRVALDNVRGYPINALLGPNESYFIGCYDYEKIYIPESECGDTCDGKRARGSRKRPAHLKRMLGHASAIFDAGGPDYAAIRAKSVAISAAWKQALPWPAPRMYFPRPIMRCSPWLIPEPVAPDPEYKPRSVWEL